jgi:probable F420-dependent oxidoreductase
VPRLPFRFGVRSGTYEHPREVREATKRAEAAGYSSFLFTDHYLGPGPAMSAGNHRPQTLASVPLAVTAAEATTTLRIGFRVLSIDYHNPIVLAKELATLDLISDGRVEVGLGAGWIEAEYDAMGITFDRPGLRIRRLEDVVALLRTCFAGGNVDFEGPSGVHAHGFEATPRPVQPGGPPIAVGGGGRRILSVAGRVADIVAFNFNNAKGALGPAGAELSDAERTDERVGWAREFADARAEAVTFEIGIAAGAVTNRPQDAMAAYRALFGMDDGAILAHPHALIGDVDSICDRIEERRERYGFSYFTIRDSAMDEFAPVVDRLAGT